MDLAVPKHCRDINVVAAELVYYSTHSKGIVIALVKQLDGYLIVAQAGILICNLSVGQNTELLLKRRPLSRLTAGCFIQRAFTDDEIISHLLRFLVLCLPDYRAQQLFYQYMKDSTTNR